VALWNGHTVRCQDTNERYSRLQVPVDVAFEGAAAKSAWRATVALGLHAHGWVRTASARLLGSAFAHPRVGESQERVYASKCRQAAAVELWQGCRTALAGNLLLCRPSSCAASLSSSLLKSMEDVHKRRRIG